MKKIINTQRMSNEEKIAAATANNLELINAAQTREELIAVMMTGSKKEMQRMAFLAGAKTAMSSSTKGSKEENAEFFAGKIYDHRITEKFLSLSTVKEQAEFLKTVDERTALWLVSNYLSEQAREELKAYQEAQEAEEVATSSDADYAEGVELANQFVKGEISKEALLQIVEANQDRTFLLNGMAFGFGYLGGWTAEEYLQAIKKFIEDYAQPAQEVSGIQKLETLNLTDLPMINKIVYGTRYAMISPLSDNKQGANCLYIYFNGKDNTYNMEFRKIWTPEGKRDQHQAIVHEEYHVSLDQIISVIHEQTIQSDPEVSEGQDLANEFLRHEISGHEFCQTLREKFSKAFLTGICQVFELNPEDCDIDKLSRMVHEYIDMTPDTSLEFAEALEERYVELRQQASEIYNKEYWELKRQVRKVHEKLHALIRTAKICREQAPQDYGILSDLIQEIREQYRELRRKSFSTYLKFSAMEKKAQEVHEKWLKALRSMTCKKIPRTTYPSHESAASEKICNSTYEKPLGNFTEIKEAI